MTEPENSASAAASLEEVQQGWNELRLQVAQLQVESGALAQENKSLRTLLERVIEHRQKSHSELVLLLTGFVSRLPMNDVGTVVSRLVEHNASVSQMLAGMVHGTADTALPEPEVLKTLDNTKRELKAAVKAAVDELLQLDTPLPAAMLQSLPAEPKLFFSPSVVRANRCFLKGQVPRERVLKEFGEAALPLFNDLTTDAKLNPRPKPEEIVLGFKADFEQLFAQGGGLAPEKRQELLALYQKVQQSKASTERARAQRNAFQRLAFVVDLLNFYQEPGADTPDVVFAQRLPALVEQLVLAGPQDALEEKATAGAESLLVYIINPDHRQTVINNVGKGGGTGRSLRYVLKLRAPKVENQDEVLLELLRHLIPAGPQRPPPVSVFVNVLRLVPTETQRSVVRHIMTFDRLRREEAEALGAALAKELGLTGLLEQLKAQAQVPPETARQIAWSQIRELIAQRGDPTLVAAAIRERLNAKYDPDELKQSWMTLTEADPLTLIRVFCHLPYRADGHTEAIARPVMETYASRLIHEKYAATYHKVANSLKNMFRAKPDTPTLVNFMALIRWVNPEAANKLCVDIGMPVPAHPIA